MYSKRALEYLPIGSITSHHLNPRKHSKKQIKQIAASIRTFGFTVPVIVDTDNRLICGHGRVAACRLLGITEIPAIRAADLDEAKIRAYMIADNRLTEIAEWDSALLADNFRMLTDLELDFDLEITGFDYGQIEQLMLNEDGSVSGEPPVPDMKDVPLIAKPGDVWLLGRHRLLCGDSLNPSSYEVLFRHKEKASVVFTDPPYNLPARDIGQICAAEHGNFAMGSGEMSRAEFTQFLATIFKNLKQWSKTASIHYICMDWRHSGEMLSAGTEVYEEFKNLCVWAKKTGGMGSFYRSQHELVFVFKSGRGKHQNHFQLGQNGRYRTNVWSYPSVMHLDSSDGDKSGKEALDLHPTIKPVAMIEDTLIDCSRRNEIVMDVFIGSGSTLIAAEKTGRVCYGIELSPRYVDVAIKRWQDWTGEKAVCEKTSRRANTSNLIA